MESNETDRNIPKYEQRIPFWKSRQRRDVQGRRPAGFYTLVLGAAVAILSLKPSRPLWVWQGDLHIKHLQKFQSFGPPPFSPWYIQKSRNLGSIHLLFLGGTPPSSIANIICVSPQGCGEGGAAASGL